MNFLAGIAFAWWTLSVALLLLSFLAALAFPRLQRRRTVRDDQPPVSAIVPVSRLDADFIASQASLFTQSYPDLEILFALAKEEPELVADVHRLQSKYPAISSRIVRSDVGIAESPKLNTLWRAYGTARQDIILTKDSNIRLAPGDLASFVRSLVPGVGLVSTISIAAEPQNLAAWTEASLINNYHGRMLMLASSLGLGFGCGKIMLFRRSDLERSGGLEGLAWALGEDAALAAAMTRLRLRTVLADRVSRQVLGSRNPLEVWQRQVRWMLIWRRQVPQIFVADFFASALPTAFAGALAAPILGADPMVFDGLTICLWFGLETLLSFSKGWPVSMWSPIAFVGREMLIFLARIRACASDSVVWGGVARQAAGKPVVSKTRPEPGVGFHTGDRG